MSGSKYEWWSENRAAIVAHSYGDVACYPNDRGDVVLKQMDDMAEDDQTVIVPIDSAERMAAAILDAAKIGREIIADIRAEAEPAPEPDANSVLPCQLRTAGRRLSHKTEMVGQGQRPRRGQPMVKSPRRLIRLVVAPELPAAGRFTARLESTGDLIVTGTRQPLVDGARELLARGFDPTTPLTMRMKGKAYDSFQPLPIGKWAGWTYNEGEKDCPTMRSLDAPSRCPGRGKSRVPSPRWLPEGRETENRFHGGPPQQQQPTTLLAREASP